MATHIVDGMYQATCEFCDTEAVFCWDCRKPNGGTVSRCSTDDGHKWVCRACFLERAMSNQKIAEDWAVNAPVCRWCGKKLLSLWDFAYARFYCLEIEYLEIEYPDDESCDSCHQKAMKMLYDNQLD
jgi:hypothetical protein